VGGDADADVEQGAGGYVELNCHLQSGIISGE
jgi:hypothetical protein